MEIINLVCSIMQTIEKWQTQDLEKEKNKLKEMFSFLEEGLQQSSAKFALIGTTSSGKSTFLNAILGVPLSPVGGEEITAGTVVVKYFSEFLFCHNGTPIDQVNKLEDVSEYLQEQMRTAREEQKYDEIFNIGYDLLFFQNTEMFKILDKSIEEIEFYDIPGLNDIKNKAQSQKIREYIQGNICLYVVDTEFVWKMLRGSQQEFNSILTGVKDLQENFKNQKVVFLLNKADKLNDPTKSNLLKWVVDGFESLLNKNNIENYVVYPFSSILAQLYGMVLQKESEDKQDAVIGEITVNGVNNLSEYYLYGKTERVTIRNIYSKLTQDFLYKVAGLDSLFEEIKSMISGEGVSIPLLTDTFSQLVPVKQNIDLYFARKEEFFPDILRDLYKQIEELYRYIGVASKTIHHLNEKEDLSALKNGDIFNGQYLVVDDQWNEKKDYQKNVKCIHYMVRNLPSNEQGQQEHLGTYILKYIPEQLFDETIFDAQVAYAKRTNAVFPYESHLKERKVLITGYHDSRLYGTRMMSSFRQKAIQVKTNQTWQQHLDQVIQEFKSMGEYLDCLHQTKTKRSINIHKHLEPSRIYKNKGKLMAIDEGVRFTEFTNNYYQKSKKLVKKDDLRAFKLMVVEALLGELPAENGSFVFPKEKEEWSQVSKNVLTYFNEQKETSCSIILKELSNNLYLYKRYPHQKSEIRHEMIRIEPGSFYTNLEIQFGYDDEKIKIFPGKDSQLVHIDYPFLISKEVWIGREADKYFGKPLVLTTAQILERINHISLRDGLEPVYTFYKKTLRLPCWYSNGYSHTQVYEGLYQAYYIKIDPTKDGYRLPTDLEWQYCALTGNQRFTPFAKVENEWRKYWKISRKPSIVGQFDSFERPAAIVNKLGMKYENEWGLIYRIDTEDLDSSIGMREIWSEKNNYLLGEICHKVTNLNSEKNCKFSAKQMCVNLDNEVSFVVRPTFHNTWSFLGTKYTGFSYRKIFDKKPPSIYPINPSYCKSVMTCRFHDIAYRTELGKFRLVRTLKE